MDINWDSNDLRAHFINNVSHLVFRADFHDLLREVVPELVHHEGVKEGNKVRDDAVVEVRKAIVF